MTKRENVEQIEAKAFTQQEALQEAVLLLTRKLDRLHPAALADVYRLLPDGAREALHFAEQDADTAREAYPGGTEAYLNAHVWPTRFTSE